jgi:hypothetical protein
LSRTMSRDAADRRRHAASIVALVTFIGPSLTTFMGNTRLSLIGQ